MNSSQRLAAQRYAAAYDALSTTVQEATRRATALYTAGKDLAGVQELLLDPRVPLAAKKNAIGEALQTWPEVSAFIEVLLEAKRYALLPEVVRQVQVLLDERKNIVRARVLSAQALSQEQQKQVEKVLSGRYGKQVEASFQTDPALLGGLKIWCNGELIDGSMQGQLLRLQEELMK